MIRLPLTPSIIQPLAVIACLLAAATARVAAQDTDALSPPAHLSYVDGEVWVDREDGTDQAEVSMPVVPGDRIRTDQGRVEVLLPGGSVLQLDAASTLDVLSEDRLRLLEGRLAVAAARTQAGALQVDTPQGSVSIEAPGDYRLRLFDAEGRPTLEVSVVRGEADLASDIERVTVATGERSWARLGEAPAYPVRFNAASFDAFDTWALARADQRRGGQMSARYVPASLRPYAEALDTGGSWSHEPTYGYVWYPRVEVGWRPYYVGRWRHYRHFGWTWIGGGSWGWATHHYGRWGLSPAGAWFWIPGAQWSPAWVSWSMASDYVSWCPIGIDNHPVIGWDRAHRGSRGAGRDRWHAWTVVPRQQFGGARVVSRVAVDGRRFDAARGPRPAFVTQDRGPAPPEHRRVAVDRDAQRSGVAVRRDGLAASAGDRGSRPDGNDARGARRFTAGAPSEGAESLGSAPAADMPPRRLPQPSGDTHAVGALPPRGDVRQRMDVERTPEDLAGTSRFGAGRSARPNTRLPGDIGPRLGSASAGGDSDLTAPGPRPNRGWSTDSIPVHRGDAIEPASSAPRADPAGVPNGVAWDRAQPHARGGAVADPPAAAGVPDRGERVGPSRGERPPSVQSGRDAPPSPRSGAGIPDNRQPPPRLAPPPAPAPPPPPSATPRQAPSGDRGGHAVPRSGPPPSRGR